MGSGRSGEVALAVPRIGNHGGQSSASAQSTNRMRSRPLGYFVEIDGKQLFALVAFVVSPEDEALTGCQQLGRPVPLGQSRHVVALAVRAVDVHRFAFPRWLGDFT